MKATKKQARSVYDSFHGTLRWLNGGTAEENEKQAPYCYELLLESVEEVKVIISNPGKQLTDDAWLWVAINELPAKAQRFAEVYNLLRKKKT